MSTRHSLSSTQTTSFLLPRLQIALDVSKPTQIYYFIVLLIISPVLVTLGKSPVSGYQDAWSPLWTEPSLNLVRKSLCYGLSGFTGRHTHSLANSFLPPLSSSETSQIFGFFFLYLHPFLTLRKVDIPTQTKKMRFSFLYFVWKKKKASFLSLLTQGLNSVYQTQLEITFYQLSQHSLTHSNCP